MIIKHDFASDILEKIEEELNLYVSENSIEVKKFSVSKMKPDFELLVKVQDYSLPISSTGSTEIIWITKTYYEILTSRWEKEHPKLVEKGIERTIKSLMENDDPEETIYFAISDKISNLIYNYNLVLEVTKESNRLFGIDDEEKILLIHLNYYEEIIGSDIEQIDFLQGITLNKKISDFILEIYIRFIRKRLIMLNPKLPKETIIRGKKLTKILWKGSQIDLLELFIELQNKGWIDNFKYGEFKKIADSICNLFDLTLTQKGKASDTNNSFYQILKGVNNKKTKKREYDEVLGNEEERKFNTIKKNE